MWSDAFGYYKTGGVYGGSKYYRQLHSVDRDGPWFAYKTSRGWCISRKLGDTDQPVRLMSGDSTDTIQTATKWKYRDGAVRYSDDSSLVVNTVSILPSPCPEITISARVHTDCAGVYHPTEEYCYGRIIYKNVTNNKVLLVASYYLGGGGHWRVLDNINSDWMTAGMMSGSAPDTCPAHPRANMGWGRTCWQYLDENDEYQDDGDFTVHCSVDHSMIQEKMSQWFSDTGVDIFQSELRQLNIPELAEITFSSSISSDSLISTVLLLFLNIVLPAMREVFKSTFSQIPFSAINTYQKLISYIGEIVESGSTAIRKVRLFTIGHQGAGKTSLLHSVR